ncbi:hypothetical protein F0562_004189 [Nyssa sinensis]|uniref:S-adenosylmethionine-dependent methyltransferase n=1 Tax=Nyssa sinensis TaxID=561372 RepID=A0A5J5C0R1_9ASTE|nr:hypothetical protein F0562_004189 [Nyssa sinensis]
MDGKNSNTNNADDPYSYTQNSEYQKELVDTAKDMVNKLIHEKLDIEDSSVNFPNTFRIADLGCSVGLNTFFAVQNIIEAIELKFKSKQQNPQIPEFHVFFNDLTSNDFNTLFRNLPPSTSRGYFAAGVPGSFHGRLFPDVSLHFVHCSSSLHWLSRVPEEVTNRDSIAWNKGRIHYTGPEKEVREAYSVQFRKDMEVFLTARALELVGGGLMVLIVSGVQDGVLPSETSIGMGFDVLGSCLEDMAKMGRVSQEKVDSFNLPFYYSSPKELKALIETNGYFDIVKLEKMATPMRHEIPNLQICTMHLRAIIRGLIEEHFGDEIIEELFDRHIKKLANSTFIFSKESRKEANFLVFLKRKVTD